MDPIIINCRDGRAVGLRHPAGDAELERLIELNLSVHGEGVAALCRVLRSDYPGMGLDDWYGAYDEATGRALSTICRIPTAWSYSGAGASVAIPAAELSIVSSAEDARGLGLSSALIKRYEDDSRRLGFPLSTIEGIPYYYRRFGYEYAAPLCVQLRLSPRLAPWVASKESPSWRSASPRPGAREAAMAAAVALSPTFRDAEPGDAEPGDAEPGDAYLLSRLYESDAAAYGVSAQRRADDWAYLLSGAQRSPETAVRRRIAMVGARAVGYLGTAPDGFGPGHAVLEAAVEPGLPPAEAAAVAAALLAEAERLRAEAGAAHLVVSLGRGHPVARLALELGADDRWEYGWQVSVIDPLAFARLAAPVLEARLGASAWAGRPFALRLRLFGPSLSFRWDGRRLAVGDGGEPAAQDPSGEGATESAASARDGYDASAALPPELLGPLALGYRSVAELRRLRHDLSAYGEAEDFLGALFPTVDAHVHQFI
ncbi:MAG: GNAT family N-acetyltransferase [Spirochaetes bacterium]|nr:GNAT family N-acetyltransferase [Spirochaetota bacterium]